MSNLISVRLTKEEHEYLMKQPGKNGAEKMRSLLHQKAIADEIAERVSSRLESQFAKRLESIESETSDIKEQYSSIKTAVNAIGENLYKIYDLLVKGEKK